MQRWSYRVGLPIVIIISLVLMYRWFWRGPTDPLVVYCAHDAMFSKQILDTFQSRTNIRLDVRLDNEVTKSLGLTEQLIAERENPRCDVFWNNQMLGTLDLAERGILHPYRGPGYERIGQRFKDPQGRFAGFAARMRVYIVNTERLEPDPGLIEQRLTGDLSRVAMAKPLWGTTLTHYAVLWHLWGPEKLRAWRRDWHQRGAVEAVGNAHVKDLVAEGKCDLGLTDTDDFFVAKGAGLPVAMRPVRVGEGQVICIPNTVAIIRGTDRLEDAKKLVDFLLSEEVELMLAASQARQIPLGPVDESQLSDEVRRLKAWSTESYDLNGLLEARRAVLAWLKSELL